MGTTNVIRFTADRLGCRVQHKLAFQKQYQLRHPHSDAFFVSGFAEKLQNIPVSAICSLYANRAYLHTHEPSNRHSPEMGHFIVVEKHRCHVIVVMTQHVTSEEAY
jgi:hypothetical protein